MFKVLNWGGSVRVQTTHYEVHKCGLLQMLQSIDPRRPPLSLAFVLCSSHREEGSVSSKTDTKQAGLSRRAALVGGALLTATSIGGDVGLQKAEAADEPAITRRVRHPSLIVSRCSKYADV